MPRLAESLRSVVVLLAAIASPLAAQDERRHGPDSVDRGLPRDPAAFLPYDAAPAHPANRIFRALWLQNIAPAEVGAAVPRGDAAAWAPGTVLQKRAGTAADARWFGGDGRLLPLEALGDAAQRELRALLDGIAADGDVARSLREQPPLAVLFQHDLLRAAERLLETKANAPLVPALVRAATAVALPAAELARVADPLRAAFAADPTFAAQLPRQLGGTAAGYEEVLRRSTRLFDAEKTLLWSRVFLAHPDGKQALAGLLPAPPVSDETGKEPTVPIGLAAVLVQGIVAIDRDGEPRATPLVFDVRTQRLVNRDAPAATNATFTHDGIDFGIWQLEREGLRRGEARAFFRRIEADDQDLFRDYGTSKHTTYRAQCSLCHRLDATPEANLGGFPVLRPHAQAAFAATGDERLRLAEQQTKKLQDRLRAARQ